MLHEFAHVSLTVWRKATLRGFWIPHAEVRQVEKKQMLVSVVVIHESSMASRFLQICHGIGMATDEALE